MTGASSSHETSTKPAASLASFASADGVAWRAEVAMWSRIREDLLDSLVMPFPPVRSGAGLARTLGVAESLRMAWLALTAAVAGRAGIDLGGRTTLAELAAVLAGATAVVVGNTGPAHLAAAVGTPVVSLFAPVVPAVRWAPHGIPHIVLGDQAAPCRDTRARVCPVPGHPCLATVTADDVVRAVARLALTAHCHG
jgi:hypothetical protein